MGAACVATVATGTNCTVGAAVTAGSLTTRSGVRRWQQGACGALERGIVPAMLRVRAEPDMAGQQAQREWPLVMGAAHTASDSIGTISTESSTASEMSLRSLTISVIHPTCTLECDNCH